MDKGEKAIQEASAPVQSRGIEEYGYEEKREMKYQIFEIFNKYDLSIAESKQLLNSTLQSIEKIRIWRFIKE